MNFKDKFPQYKTLNNDPYYMNQVPRQVVGGMQSIILSMVRNEELDMNLKSVVNLIAEKIPYEPTSNWGWDFLVADLSDYLGLLSKKFNKFMDFIQELVNNHRAFSRVGELNELFAENNFGYLLVQYDEESVECNWSYYKEPDLPLTEVQELSEQVSSTSEQARSHLEQLLKQASEIDNERSRKDALRDALSALEALVNSYGHSNDLERNTKDMANSNQWGDPQILTNAIRIWKHIHYRYPDVRHGNNSVSSLSRHEACYFIEYVASLIRFICRIDQDRI